MEKGGVGERVVVEYSIGGSGRCGWELTSGWVGYEFCVGGKADLVPFED